MNVGAVAGADPGVQGVVLGGAAALPPPASFELEDEPPASSELWLVEALGAGDAAPV